MSNIFCTSNPSKIIDALWFLIKDDINIFKDIVIFLPNNRTIETVKTYIYCKNQNIKKLPTFIAFGDDNLEENDNIITDVNRVFLLVKLLINSNLVASFEEAIRLAEELILFQDYLSNEGINIRDINWNNYIDLNLSEYYEKKIKFIDVLNIINKNVVTETEQRNSLILSYKDKIKNYKKIIVCGSTASVYATSCFMEYVASLPNGYIILPGKIDFQNSNLKTNPYYSEAKFLNKINNTNINIIYNGQSNIDFFNQSFSNQAIENNNIKNIRLIECEKESDEAELVADIVNKSLNNNKTVLIITTDIVANQRLKEVFKTYNIQANFSSGINGKNSSFGRTILNLLNTLEDNNLLLSEYLQYNNLFSFIENIIEKYKDNLEPEINETDESINEIYEKIKSVSNNIQNFNINIKSGFDIISLVSYCLNSLTFRLKKNNSLKVSVLGNIEARMQTADVVILTGLNEGMFPKNGYNTNLFSKKILSKIGLFSTEKKISLMALDFMVLSCNSEVYWLRAKNVGGSSSIESRFITRAKITSRNSIETETYTNKFEYEYKPIINDYYPVVYNEKKFFVTDLNYLINNPYVFYVKKILKLDVKKDYWQIKGYEDFGNIIHSVIETETDFSKDKLLQSFIKESETKFDKDDITFYFWKKRFIEIADFIERYFEENNDSYFKEVQGSIVIENNQILARADIIADGVVIDVKTGSKIPSDSSLKLGLETQLPIEAYIMKQNGFFKFSSEKTKNPIMKFLHLANNNLNIKVYDSYKTNELIENVLCKVKEVIQKYSNKSVIYEYSKNIQDDKYKIFKDLAREFN